MLLILFLVAQADLINRPFDFPFSPEELGFPPNVSREGLPTCDEYGDNYDPPCTRAGMLVHGYALLPNIADSLFSPCRPHGIPQVKGASLRTKPAVHLLKHSIRAPRYGYRERHWSDIRLVYRGRHIQAPQHVEKLLVAAARQRWRHTFRAAILGC